MMLVTGDWCIQYREMFAILNNREILNLNTSMQAINNQFYDKKNSFLRKEKKKCRRKLILKTIFDYLS